MPTQQQFGQLKAVCNNPIAAIIPTSDCTRFWVVGLFGVLVGVNLVGCGIGSSETVDDHLEHHIPDHKPTTFVDAVEQVRQRHARIATTFQTAESGALAHELSELLDILGWLTELAADSPMKKPEWDQVNALSKALMLVYRQILEVADRRSGRTWPEVARRVDDDIESLTSLIPFAEFRP